MSKSRLNLQHIELEGPKAQTITKPPSRRIGLIVMTGFVVAFVGMTVLLATWTEVTRAAMTRVLGQ